MVSYLTEIICQGLCGLVVLYFLCIAILDPVDSNFQFRDVGALVPVKSYFPCSQRQEWTYYIK